MDNVPTITANELKSADTVCLTGGDPFLYSGLQTFISRLREQYPNIKNLYAYTSGSALYHYLDPILGRKWDKEFNVPDNEIFRKLPILFDSYYL